MHIHTDKRKHIAIDIDIYIYRHMSIYTHMLVYTYIRPTNIHTDRYR